MSEFLERYSVPLSVLLAAAISVIIVHVAGKLTWRAVSDSPVTSKLVSRLYRPTQVLGVLTAVQIALLVTDGAVGRGPVVHGLKVASIAAGAWMIGAVLHVVEDAVAAQVTSGEVDPDEARRRSTQVSVVRRMGVVVLSVLAGGAMLLTFEQARTIGASLLASAGVFSVVAAWMAQSMLRNLLAGLQLTFGNVLNLGDTVVINGYWGKIEEITLSWVVLRVWDDRRLVLPTSQVTTLAFENWTKNGRATSGLIDLEVDRTLPVEELRRELRAFLATSSLWDGQVASLWVVDAVGPMMRLQAMVSTDDGPEKLWALSCAVREHLIAWLSANHPESLPRFRAEISSPYGTSAMPDAPVAGVGMEGHRETSP